MRSQFPSGFVALAILSSSFSAAADAPRIHISAAAAHATSGHQKDEFGWGVAALPAIEFPLTRALGLELEVSALWLSEGAPPLDPNLVPEGAGSAFGAVLGPRFRPFASSHDGTRFSPSGFWLAGGAGVSSTNGLWRPLVDAELGFDFLDARGRAGMGPMLGYYHVFQPDSALRPDDASLLMVGVHALFDLGEGVRLVYDRDRDGIYDEDDSCPDQPEDRDQFQDEDGCPDLDDDRDGVPDTKDRCPRVPEDKDGFEDDDGCPEADNDKDGILDAKDRCPLVPEDKDGFEDADGCPDLDNDKDGIPDVTDLCPFEPETVNGYADSDGCPDEDQVRVIGDNIVLDDRVHFMVNSQIIRRQSFGLLERLAKLINDHPEYVHIAIEGHADERGPDSFNQPLSENRARAVLEFLVKQGIARARLSSQGRGEYKPLDARKSEFAYFQNRRVDFIITRQSSIDPNKPASLPAPPPPVGPDGVKPPPDTGGEAEPQDEQGDASLVPANPAPAQSTSRKKAAAKTKKAKGAAAAPKAPDAVPPEQPLSPTQPSGAGGQKGAGK